MRDQLFTYRDRVLGGWLGKAVGGTLGMPVEGQDGPFDFSFYHPVPTEMVPNDDLDLQIVWACRLAQMARPEIHRSHFIRAWQENIGFPWDEYGVCKRNLNEGLLPPWSGSFDNWFVNGMGAAIRSELWACLAPGDPKLAAAYAYEDACLDHDGNGIQAEVWLAAMQSAAFVESDLDAVIRTGWDALPVDSALRRALEDTQRAWDESGDWKAVRSRILKKYGHENFTNVTENMAFVLLALRVGGGDFSRSICTAVNCGKDTDCTAASVGALLGILNPACLEDRWLRPIGRDLVLSPGITGIKPPATLDAFTDLVVSLHDRIGERPPLKTEGAPMPVRNPIAGRVGFKAVPWFGQGWPTSLPLELELPPMREFPLIGTCGTFSACEFEGETLFLEIPFRLTRPVRSRVFFNTPNNCRVFLDGAFVFGRDGGRMAPSAHRVPLHQYTDGDLAAGEHRLVAAIYRPGEDPVSWVVGVADRDNALQWVPDVWIRVPVGDG